jgi:hypothetical protein
MTILYTAELLPTCLSAALHSTVLKADVFSGVLTAQRKKNNKAFSLLKERAIYNIYFI